MAAGRLPWLGCPNSEPALLVCHCKAVNDQRIRALIDSGARDEVDIAAACGVGTDCGGCLPAVHRLLDECLACPLRPVELFVDAAPAAAVG